MIKEICHLISLLKNRTFVLALAFILGLVFSDAANFTGMLTLPALALVFTVSTTQFSVKDFFPLGKLIRPFILGFAFNYLLLGSVILLLAWWLMPTRDLWIGFVLVAAAPPGIAIIPFTYIVRGDANLSMLSTFGVYAFLLPLHQPSSISLREMPFHPLDWWERYFN